MKAIDNDLSDEERRKVAKERLEALGWVFRDSGQAVYVYRSGEMLQWFYGGPKILDLAIQFASHAQARIDAGAKR